jgi:hypothetical protein
LPLLFVLELIDLLCNEYHNKELVGITTAVLVVAAVILIIISKGGYNNKVLLPAKL